jgi:hypothetical protein
MGVALAKVGAYEKPEVLLDAGLARDGAYGREGLSPVLLDLFE